ncbi:hypothetical protein Vafri_10711 [Volvox africanus]|uniref:LysM domain-containing protein n=2 Tax=Volvox africanus TaxID=51714 RepID=A0A8J4F0Q2_9CHLO|nr:hypothetical protein Vafri_10711 [Volvox africanus]
MSELASRWSVLGTQLPNRLQAQATTKENPSSIESTYQSTLYPALAVAFSRLAPKELAQCRAVCTLWREAASSTEVRRAAFMKHWRLAGLVGSARNPTILDTAALGQFVRRHVVCRGDTLTGLAVRHGCEVTTIMRLNNLISYHSLHSRENVFLPVASASELAGGHVLFHYCRIACRELLVLLNDAEAQTARAAIIDAEGRGIVGGSGLRKVEEEALKGKLVALLCRSRQLDQATARFYLAETGWCLKKALALYEQDLQWECRSPGGRRRRRAPLQPLQD